MREEALKRLGDLKIATDNQYVTEVLAVLDASVLESIDAILNMPVDGLASFLVREQLMGEVRGLRRFGLELADRRNALIEFTKDPQQ